MDRVADAAVHANLDEPALVDGSFDVITCLDVIEHLRRPDVDLARMFQLLKVGGILMIVTPNVSSLHRWLCGRRWVHYHIDHLWYFCPETLTRVVRQAGFEVVECRSARKVFNLAYILGVFGNTANSPLVRSAANFMRRCLPRPLARTNLPALREGIYLMARKTTSPSNHE